MNGLHWAQIFLWCFYFLQKKKLNILKDICVVCIHFFQGCVCVNVCWHSQVPKHIMWFKNVIEININTTKKMFFLYTKYSSLFWLIWYRFKYKHRNIHKTQTKIKNKNAEKKTKTKHNFNCRDKVKYTNVLWLQKQTLPIIFIVCKKNV